jgi:hypothetical protein
MSTSSPPSLISSVIASAADENIDRTGTLVGNQRIISIAAHLRFHPAGEVAAEDHVTRTGSTAVGIGSIGPDNQIIKPVPIDVPGAAHAEAGKSPAATPSSRKPLVPSSVERLIVAANPPDLPNTT